MSEFIYVLENPSMPGLVKIGRTERSVSERVIELSSHTGVPTGFAVVKEYAVANSFETERTIHERLSNYRVSDNREFFKIEAEDAIAIIDSMLEVVKFEKQRDFEREDELIARALPIVAKQGIARPRMLEELLGISYEEALFVIQSLRGRGLIGQRNESGWTSYPRPPVLSKKPKPVVAASTSLIENYQLPSMDFLQMPDTTVMPGREWKEEVFAKARLIQQTLAQHDIEVSLGDITKGTTLTRYELFAAPGVKLEEISALSKNLAAALKSEHIKIITPIPGKKTVGVDVPNAIKTKVIMRDLLESEEWTLTKARVPVALGKDVYGHPIIADLAEMPHLLIGGNTGSGKSVCLHVIIASLLYRFSPDQVRFMMIDPNGVELVLYSALPHLVAPVVSDPFKSVLALRWLVNEMDKRFEIFRLVGVTRIGSFNSRSINLVGSVGGDIVIPQKLSYVVVVIENLEDLMQVAKADAESALEHLIQNGRAAGIHLVLTTRQANQNLISENIKTEIPARIAFRCASRIESRSIIGEAGAETLLGKGDMLFLTRDSTKLVRAQGALISDQEIQHIGDFIATQGKASYVLDLHKQLSRPTGDMADESGCDEDEDLIQQCIEVFRSEQMASVSLIQRRLRLGYTRAANVMDELENRGIVGPSKGAEPRDILIDLGVDVCTTPVEQPPIIQPHIVVCACEHCSGRIEFDANELGDRQSVSVSCPHCGTETEISNSC
jgi:DNA segregation ATPase FtsK/SpoIIIE-like protein